MPMIIAGGIVQLNFMPIHPTSLLNQYDFFTFAYTLTFMGTGHKILLSYGAF